jgi:aryl-alcohol dehydrogenase-like predicted oxidoreductase
MNFMLLKPLGSTSTNVSTIGQGTNGIGGITEVDNLHDLESIRLLRLGIDLGMTFIDTAEVHGKGHCEEIIGEAIKGRIRDTVFIATKFSPKNSNYNDVMQAAQRSLKRLGTGYIDLFQVHHPNPHVPLKETLHALETLVKQEKIRYVGLCDFDPVQIRESMTYLPPQQLVSIQNEYNLWEQSAEKELIPFSKDNKLTFIAYTPFYYGKIAPVQKTNRLFEIAIKNNITVSQLVLNWIVRENNVITIPKSSNEAHLKENASALDVKISSQDLQRVSELIIPKIENIPVESIKIPVTATDGSNRKLYTTKQDAVGNLSNIIPSPIDLAEQIRSGLEFKPIKVSRASVTESGAFVIEQARPPVVTRYWAWVIAYDGKKPIPAILV